MKVRMKKAEHISAYFEVGGKDYLFIPAWELKLMELAQ